LEDPGGDRRTLHIKRMLKKCDGTMSTQSYGTSLGQTAGQCKCSHKPSASIKCGSLPTDYRAELNVLWHSTGFPSGMSGFFVSPVCLLVHVTMVDKNKTVVYCSLATSAIMLSKTKKRKRKMWSKKWYWKRNISCDGRLSALR
jgi:hypothetical protein